MFGVIADFVNIFYGIGVYGFGKNILSVYSGYNEHFV